MWEYRATLTAPIRSLLYDSVRSAVHDGDTVKVLIDLGFDARTEKWIRLADVSAPELSQPGGSETTQFVTNWLLSMYYPDRALRRWPLKIVTEMTGSAEPSEQQSFARYVGWIYDLVSGECLNEAVTAYLADHPEWPHGRAL